MDVRVRDGWLGASRGGGGTGDAVVTAVIAVHAVAFRCYSYPVFATIDY